MHKNHALVTDYGRDASRQTKVIGYNDNNTVSSYDLRAH